ncbi:hypothetical protein SAMD00019534_052300 [Acytostelium subglobosum LB1]|uniref:hypothetical protein n=1 Tax=Acytostelium subglobosum LB1 TaxID=1410327 RepID=UPI0006450FDC|nr:hypothetical protein SAMD00019534_052300 [Acytostelium subglobosum LB1]GAM22055.1 hypothetical protein SAMD00019534_052300 [Acytostelium subglobosum LB1]|eukprot:XP_012755155.1 hypothetical protein SAMD00019534_052300 [Acytostelium subglobosum LB1]
MSFQYGSPNAGRRGGYQGGQGGGQRPPRPMYQGAQSSSSSSAPPQEDDVKAKLTSLIVRIGDKSTSALESNIEGLVSVLLPDLSKNNANIQTILFKCISQLPYKTPIYATIVGKMNLKNHEFGKEIVCTLVDELNDCLAKQRFNSAKLLVRFIGGLVLTNVLPAQSMFETFETLLSVLNQADYTQTKADFYVYLVMTTIPWVAGHLAQTHQTQLQSLLEELESYLSSRSHADKKFYQTFTENDDRLELLMKQIKLQKENNWQCTAIIQVNKQFDFSEASQHVLPPITIPSDDSKFNYPTFTRPVFRLFDDSADGSLQPIDRHVLEEYIVDILYFFNGNHKDASKFIYTLPVQCEIDHIVVETILSEAFRLPQSQFKSIYYSVLFVDLFKDQHATIIPVFAYAINMLYENIDQLDVEAVSRFALMFAHHLSNYEYKWVWADWSTAITTTPDADNELLVSLQRKFLKHLLESIVRLSYLDKIKQLLPQEYHPYLPSAPTANFKFPKPDFADEEIKEMVAQSHRLLLMFKQKDPIENIIQYVAALPTEQVNVVDLVTKCILHLGSTSFSHLTYAVERYVTLFKTNIKSTEDRHQCIKSTVEFWRSSHQHIVIVIDKLITYKILSPIDPVTYLVSGSHSDAVTDPYVWEIINNSIEKTNIIIDTLTKDYEASMNSPEKELRLKSAQNEQSVLFTTLFVGMGTLLKNPMIDPVSTKLLSGYVKSTARRYFDQVKPLFETNPEVLDVIKDCSQ